MQNTWVLRAFWPTVLSSGIYSYTYAAERQENCVACSQIPKDLIFSEEARLSDVMEYLSSTYQMKGPGVTTTDDQGRNRTLYLPNIASIEERTRPNLKKTLRGSLFRDTLPNWIACLRNVVCDRTRTEGWSAVDRGRRHYAKLDRIPLETPRRDGYVTLALRFLFLFLSLSQSSWCIFLPP